MSEALVRMEGIEKHFPGVHALHQCRLELAAGEVHALVGENGAGKSTLMKIATGVYQKDEGRIFLKGKEVNIPNTRAAQQLGISMIHQELNLMPDLTIAQNIFIGREPRKGIKLFVDDRKLNDQAQQLLNEMNLQLDPRTKVSELTVAKQQMVEIAKALSFQSEVLIMDEPTAALTNAEIEELFRIIEQLRGRGVGIVYISHRMEELKRITDRITVMRDGRYIDTVLTKDTTIDQIIAMMVGRELYVTSQQYTVNTSVTKVLEVTNLNRGSAVKDVTFHLAKGEILGFAGLMGAGRTEVARAIFGADAIDSGDIRIHGHKVQLKAPHDAVKHGIGYLSEDRKRYGLMVDMDVKTNIAIASYRKARRLLGWMHDGKIDQSASHFVEALQIKTPSIHQQVKFLSGGNQQKVVIGKWLLRDCDILIFDEPTRGIDVGAKTEIYKLLDELAAQGKSIIMISSELPEILRMSHRIMVMCEGRITGELRQQDATQEAIMKYATMRIS
ncbi:sugar ABC transporter ATP-binding protein [Paenibacillus alginolyticus]|uniref:Sugar ABC transporter ATP-binding protein n=1 Tax=Paenibacillus alginolyticus TaxID=59839 RepID=A0ABT4GK14_9BACL|nr:sugar ABC transporter ATP-binding protein [Paenibacillus alginolyticus]MCY9696378.1 sugar ABC transporter ATP-binding protein [Paenibacillus alginolyticus]MEC0143157.1 sugar ABC transporter ATP-binding protein [Paenibacillus alginolyticus]